MRGAANAKRKPTAGRPRAERARARRVDLRAVYRTLIKTHGPQEWWPGDGAFEIMVGAVLTQNTAWINVERAIDNLKRAGALSPELIVRAHPRRLASWLRPSGYFNVKAARLKSLCRWLLAQGGVRALGRRPTASLRQALLEVHGIGPETADDILLYAFGRPVFVIDAYTRRLFARLGAIAGNEDYETLRARFETSLPPSVSLYNEFHALIVAHAKDVCRPRPRCETCCLRGLCPAMGLPR